MTYGKLKLIASSLLVGDNKLPKENDQILALLEMAYIYLIDNCQVLNLQTEDKSAFIHRLGRGKFMVRKPDLPKSDNDELDVDDSLGPVLASLIASYISDKKTQIHQARADRGIKDYNAKVDEFIESLEEFQGVEQ